MPATFVVEDGTGLPNANAYLAEAAADQYFLDHSDPSAWSALASSLKQKAIRLATQYLDTRYNGRWLGTARRSTQALGWPRSGVRDQNGNYIASDSVPQKLKDACCEMALRSLTEDIMADLSNSGTVESESITVGPISTSTSYVGGNPPTKKYLVVDRLMREFVEHSTKVARA